MTLTSLVRLRDTFLLSKSVEIYFISEDNISNREVKVHFTEVTESLRNTECSGGSVGWGHRGKF